MTITHLLPSLRRSLPTPLDRDAWPEFTTAGLDDVTVAGVSLTRLADWCGTPCAHTAAAVIPHTGGIPSPTELASVVVTRVLSVSTADDGTIDAWVDARLAGCTADVAETRLIGRISTAHDTEVRLRSAGGPSKPSAVPQLGGDLRAGDLLAIPCVGAATLRGIDPERHRFSRDDDPAAPWPAVCGR
ncbi:VWA domain-containing protein [Leifsonia poae]|uniref:VWA domain-containing protein n=1 Tax=Leifsonia poae TaxID=110933 RepID=UPI001CBAE167|nr:VWA domain-containing protein [Leifsonia poae]